MSELVHGRVAAGAATLLGLALAFTGAVKLAPLALAAAGVGTVPPTAYLPGWLLAATATVEAGVGIALALRPASEPRLRVAAALAAALLVGALAFVVARVPLAHCGCFGAVAPELETFHVAAIGVLLLLAGVAFAAGPVPADAAPATRS